MAATVRVELESPQPILGVGTEPHDRLGSPQVITKPVRSLGGAQCHAAGPEPSKIGRRWDNVASWRSIRRAKPTAYELDRH